MKNIFVLILFCFVFNMVSCSAQPCAGFSIGQFFDELKVQKMTSEKLTFKKYSDFDFVSFRPVYGQVADSLHSVDIGYDDKNNVKELIFRKLNQVYALSVYGFKDHRILVLKRRDNSGEWLYTPTAILTSKCGNYMINVLPLFENNYNPYQLFKYFPITTFDKVSCLMSLREDLYPDEVVKFSNGKIVMHSGLKYEFERSVKLEMELIHFFIDAEHFYSNLGIERKSDMKEILDRTIILRTESNMIVFTRPNVFKEIEAPLWIFSGAHSYFSDK